MIRGFYSGQSGMMAQQHYLNTISNNIANVNTHGFKGQQTAFASLMYADVTGGGGSDIATGHGSRVQKNGLVLTQGALLQTGQAHDFAIDGGGFFSVRDSQTGEQFFTRDGSFSISVEGGQDFLVDYGGRYVLGQDGQALDITNGLSEADLGVFSFRNPYGLSLVGDNCFMVSDRSGAAEPGGDSRVVSGYLEGSSTDMGREAVKMIEASKAFSFNARIVQTADDMERVINQLR